MKRRFGLASILFYAATALVIITSAVSFISSLSWIDKPFPGFLIFKYPYGGSFSSKAWPSMKAGLKFMDRIVAADDQPIREGADVLAVVKEKKLGSQIHYTLERSGQIRKVAIPITQFSLIDWALIFLIPFVGGLLLFALGFIVFLLKPYTSTSWVFFLFCLFSSLYMITGFDIQATYIFYYLHTLVIPFIPATLVHLGLIFPLRKVSLFRYPSFEYLIYLPAFILALAYQLYFFTFLRFDPAPIWVPDIPHIVAVSRIFTLSSVPAMIALASHSVLRASSNIIKQRAKMILLGVTFAFLPTGLIMLLVLFFKINFPWNFLVFFVLIFPGAIAYSIVKHNLFDFDTIIRQSFGYVLVTGGISGIYALLLYIFNVAFGRFDIAESPVFPLLFILAVVFLFNPMRNQAQKLIDRIFFRLEYDYHEIIRKISETMRALLNLEQIGKCIMDTALGEMFISSGRILLFNPEKQMYECLIGVAREKDPAKEGVTISHAAIDEPMPADDPLVKKIAERKREVTLYDIQEDPLFDRVKESCISSFQSLGASLIVPLIYEGNLTGLISLGEKKSGKYYCREDINVLKTLANQGAVAIENAKLAEQMKNEEKVRGNLARYLSPQIVDQIIRNNVQVNLGGDKKVVTVLFSDIRSFTRISETLPPDQLVQLLNEYFTEMAKIIFQNQGSLDKYIGDAIVAVFGSLISINNPARTATQAAVQMMKSLSIVNQRWTAQYGFPINIGIGVNTGEVFLGNIGSPERMEFTVIGDTVNIASRLSGAARPGQILITKETLAHLGSDIPHQALPPIEVKGKTGKLDIFEVVYS
jgi:adenylate cyclase